MYNYNFNQSIFVDMPTMGLFIYHTTFYNTRSPTDIKAYRFVQLAIDDIFNGVPS